MVWRSSNAVVRMNKVESYSTTGMVSAGMGDHLWVWASHLCIYVISHTGQLSLLSSVRWNECQQKCDDTLWLISKGVAHFFGLTILLVTGKHVPQPSTLMIKTYGAMQIVLVDLLYLSIFLVASN